MSCLKTLGRGWRWLFLHNLLKKNTDRTKDNFCVDMAGAVAYDAMLITVNANNLDNPKNMTSWREKKITWEKTMSCFILLVFFYSKYSQLSGKTIYPERNLP